MVFDHHASGLKCRDWPRPRGMTSSHVSFRLPDYLLPSFSFLPSYTSPPTYFTSISFSSFPLVAYLCFPSHARFPLLPYGRWGVGIPFFPFLPCSMPRSHKVRIADHLSAASEDALSSLQTTQAVRVKTTLAEGGSGRITHFQEASSYPSRDS